MFIIPFPWNHRELENLHDENDVFDLIMEDCIKQYYLIIQDNTITWIGEGTVPGHFAVQLRFRSSTMNGSQGTPQFLGNVGFLGRYSGVEDAILKLFPKDGYCASNMKYEAYKGQKLKGNKNHYYVITPLLCLLRGGRYGCNSASSELQHFFQTLGWRNRKHFDCSGTWNNDMKLYIDSNMISTLEIWFTNYCAIALG